MSTCTSLTFAHLNSAWDIRCVSRRQLHRKEKLYKVTKVCTLPWFNRKCSSSAVRTVLSYCKFSEQEKGKSVVATQLTSPPWRTSASGCPCHRPSTPSCQTEYCWTVYRHGEISLWRQTRMQRNVRAKTYIAASSARGCVRAQRRVGVHSLSVSTTACAKMNKLHHMQENKCHYLNT